MNSIEIKGVSKNFKKLLALDDVNINLKKGRIIGLLGRNGAGKSTLMRCIQGFLNFDGEIIADGIKVNHNHPKIAEKVAFIPDVDCLDNRLTVKQTIDFVAGVNPNWNAAKAQQLLEVSELPLNKKVKKLSKGMKTKLYLLITLSLDVDILLLDEPTLGLDIIFRKEFFNTIIGDFFDESKTILISTHQVEEVEHILQDIIFIDNGKIVLYEDVEELKEKYNFYTVPASQKHELMQHNPSLVTKSLGHVSALLPSNLNIEGAEKQMPTLSDLFLAKVGGTNETV